MTKVYSYSRWSSTRQGKGSTLERQEELAKQFADKHGYELVSNYRDRGVSAFKGQNSAIGVLANFKAACEAGEVPKGSWLVVESLDRLSRDRLTEAHGLFMSLMAYVNIHSCMDGKNYEMGAEHSQILNDLMYSLMIFARAHEESLTKQQRTIAAAKIEIEKAKRENYAIKSVGSNVWWVDVSTGKVEKDEVYFEIAKEIVGLLLSGVGYYRILKILNHKYPNPPKTSGRENGGRWSSNLIRNFHKNPALHGRKTVTLGEHKEVIENYYPQLCSEEDYSRILIQKKINKSTTTTREYIPLLSGKRIFKCGHCEHSMSSLRMRHIPRYMCLGGQSRESACNAWSVKAEWIDVAFFDVCIPLLGSFRNSIRPADTAGIEEQITLVEARVDFLKRVVAREKKVERMDEAYEQIDALYDEIDRLRIYKEQEILREQEELIVSEYDSASWVSIGNDLFDLGQDDLRQSFKDFYSIVFKRLEIKKLDGSYQVDAYPVGGEVISFRYSSNKVLEIVNDRILKLKTEERLAFAIRMICRSMLNYKVIITPHLEMNVDIYKQELGCEAGGLVAAHVWALYHEYVEIGNIKTENEIANLVISHFEKNGEDLDLFVKLQELR